MSIFVLDKLLINKRWPPPSRASRAGPCHRGISHSAENALWCRAVSASTKLN